MDLSHVVVRIESGVGAGREVVDVVCAGRPELGRPERRPVTGNLFEILSNWSGTHPIVPSHMHLGAER